MNRGSPLYWSGPWFCLVAAALPTAGCATSGNDGS